jgi:hypothetical protein
MVRQADTLLTFKRTGARVQVCPQHRAELLARHEDVSIAPLGTDRERLGCCP